MVSSCLIKFSLTEASVYTFSSAFAILHLTPHIVNTRITNGNRCIISSTQEVQIETPKTDHTKILILIWNKSWLCWHYIARGDTNIINTITHKSNSAPPISSYDSEFHMTHTTISTNMFDIPNHKDRLCIVDKVKWWKKKRTLELRCRKWSGVVGIGIGT